jgi:hypothetical protein
MVDRVVGWVLFVFSGPVRAELVTELISAHCRIVDLGHGGSRMQTMLHWMIETEAYVDRLHI